MWCELTGKLVELMLIMCNGGGIHTLQVGELGLDMFSLWGCCL